MNEKITKYQLPTKIPQLNVKISIDWSSRYQDPNSNHIIEETNCVKGTLHGRIYQNIKKSSKSHGIFFRHIDRRLSLVEKITLRGRALRVIPRAIFMLLDGPDLTRCGRKIRL